MVNEETVIDYFLKNSQAIYLPGSKEGRKKVMQEIKGHLVIIKDVSQDKYVLGRVQHSNNLTYRFREEFAHKEYNLCYKNLKNIFSKED